MMNIKWVLIGEVAAPQGNRGEIKVIPHTEFPERFQEMDKVRLFTERDEEPRRILEVEGCRFHKGAVILKLKDVDSIDAAEELRGMFIKVSKDEVVPLPEGSYYIFELVGLECVTTTAMSLGRITDVLQTGANDVYVVKPNPGVTKLSELLIPAVNEVVLDINLEKGQVLIELMDGLLD